MFTALFCYFAIHSSTFYTIITTRSWISYLSLIGCVVSQLIVLFAKPNQTTKVAALSAFTLFESILVGRICSGLCWTQTKQGLYFDASSSAVISQAALMTVGLVILITLYAFYTKKDYTMGSALFSMACSSLALLMLFLMFSRNQFVHSIYIYLSLLVFGFYLIIDTQRIVGGKSVELKSDEYITGAMLIYADIIVLFLKILSLLSKKKDD